LDPNIVGTHGYLEQWNVNYLMIFRVDVFSTQMSVQSRPPKLSSPTKRLVELSLDEMENETPNAEIVIGMFFYNLI
jgi:hypothetical protein